jgi:GntR family transcriptional regulator
MIFRIDLHSPTSVYRQICDQIKYAVASGALSEGDRLPTIRDVAEQTRVNRNTIARAYAELEREGVTVSRQGQGSFIAERASGLQKAQRMRVLEEMARDLFVQAYHFQISPEEVRTLLDRVERHFDREQVK